MALAATAGLFFSVIHQSIEFLHKQSFSHEPNAIGSPVLHWPQASSTWLSAGGAIAEACVGAWRKSRLVYPWRYM